MTGPSWYMAGGHLPGDGDSNEETCEHDGIECDDPNCLCKCADCPADDEYDPDDDEDDDEEEEDDDEGSYAESRGYLSKFDIGG